MQNISHTNSLLLRRGDINKGFTLVELIVVITILAILGTIAFLSFQGYSKSSRDGVRVSDVNSMKKSLELFQIQTGKLPLPDNGVAMTYSGGTVWTQGTFGENVLNKVQKLNKLPVDPLNGVEYTYSTTFSQKEYELGTIFEGDLVSYNQTYALGTEQATAYVSGNYNGLIAKMLSGGTVYILAVPSIISRDLVETDIANLITSNELVFNGYANLPSSYLSTTFNVEGGFDNNQTQIEVYSGTGMIDESGLQTFMQNLQGAYSGTILADTNYIDAIIEANTTGNTNIINEFGSELVNNSLGTEIQTTELPNSCVTWPGYSNVQTQTEGTPTLPNTAWQQSNNSNPCYYECSTGFEGVDCATSTVLITSTECTNAGWFWVNNTQDVYIGTTRGEGFCISPRVGNISFNGWGHDSDSIYNGWNAASVRDTGNAIYRLGQTRSLDSSSGYSCKGLGLSSSDFDTSDTIVGRMKWLATNKSNASELQDIEWVVGAIPPNSHKVPASYIADCLDGIKDLGTTMTYTHNNDTTDEITYAEYNANKDTTNQNATYPGCNYTSTDTGDSNCIIYQNRLKYLVAWTQKSGSHLPSVMSYITNGYNSATDADGDFLIGNDRGEYQVACEASLLTDTNDDTDNRWILTSALGDTNGGYWGRAIRLIGANGCSDQTFNFSGNRHWSINARFIVRP